MSQEITYYCSFCDKSETVKAPTTFTSYLDADVENAACRDHTAAMAFLHDQCPGCVSGWGECRMFMAIGNKEVTSDDLAIIRQGKCPHRVNGTCFLGANGLEQIDISETSESGEAFARAIETSQSAHHD